MGTPLNIAVIGVDHAAENLLDGYRALAGDELAGVVAGTAFDQKDIAHKRQTLGFEICPGAAAPLLEEMQPAIIVFSPAPDAAREILRTQVKPYYDELREKGGPPPNLYALTPNLLAGQLRDILGADVHVVNLALNRIRRAGGKDASQEGFSLLSFAEGDDWPEKDRSRLLNFLAPYGRYRIVPEERFLNMLSGVVAAHTAVEAAQAVADLLKRDDDAEKTRIGRLLLQAHRREAVDDRRLFPALQAVSNGILEGTVRALTELGVPVEEAREIQGDELLRQYTIAMAEDPSEAIHDIIHDATPGGLTEHAEITFQQTIVPELKAAFADLDHIDAEKLHQTIEKAYYDLVRGLAAFGRQSDEKLTPRQNTIEQHAVILALLAKYALHYAGDAGKDAFISGVTRVGVERGTRMAARAILRGDKLDYVNYQAYSEWNSLPGQMNFVTVQTWPETVTEGRKCAWNEAWHKYGLEDYGKYFCVTIDAAIIEGFNPAFHCDIRSNMSWGARCCEFHWGIPMSEADQERLAAKRAELGDSCIKNFDYHIGHVLHSIGDELRSALGEEAGRRIVERAVFEFTKMFGREYAVSFENIYPGDSTRL